jgi:hypothetical protein
LLSDAADAAQRLLEGQETFRVEHELQIVEDANGERFLRDNIFGFRFWNQTITELGSYSWSSMVPMENAVMGTRLPLQQNGATLTVPSHPLRFELGLAALTFLHGETFPIDDACSIVIATRVAQQVSGTDPQALVSACEAGVAGLEKGVRDALAALDSPIELELQGVGTIENDKISGVWQGSLTTAMIPTSSLVNARFK